MNVIGVISLIAGAAGFGAIAWLVVFAVRGDPERAAEEAARRHFDEHGYWPDEQPVLGPRERGSSVRRSRRSRA